MTLSELVKWLMKRKRLGVRDATAVAMALAQWSIASERVGHFASLREFREWSGESERTVERRRARIRAVLSERELRWAVDELLAHDLAVSDGAETPAA